MRLDSERNSVRRYLLKQLSEAGQQDLELRLLSDEEFAEELEIVEDELIDEYIADELSRDERASFEETFLAHPERRQKLEAGQALKRYFGSLPPPKPPPSPMWAFLDKWIGQPLFSSPARAAVPLFVVVVIGLSIWVKLLPSDLDKGLQALNEAYRQERPVEARVSNLDHAPFITRRGTEPEQVNTFERSNAERLLSDAFKEHGDADSYHALGKFHLLQKDTGKAIEYLEQARKAEPDNPQINADLGAAYLEKAKQELGRSDDANSGKGLEDLGRSLEHLKQALELNPNLLEALFNRALVHEYQGLYPQAEADWRAYLEKDSTTQWAVEARERLKSLESKKALGAAQDTGDSFDSFMHACHLRDDEEVWKIYKRNHSATGNRMTRALVDEFLSDNPKHKPDEVLQSLDYLGQLEIRKAQDRYTYDLARFYTFATPQSKTLLVQTRQQVKQGFELVQQSKIDEAAQLFVSARGTFKKLGNIPELLTIDAELAHGAAVQPDLAKGQEILARTIPECESLNYKWLLAHSLSHLAQIEWSQNNYSKAFSDSNRSLRLFQELDDTSNVSGTLLQSASMHLFLHDNETSWSYLRRAFAVAEMQNISASDLWGIYIAISLNLHALQLYRAALDYQNEALQLARGLTPPRPLMISRSYQYIGLTYGSLGQFNLGVQNVRLAYEQGQPIANERNGRNMMASSSLKLGDLYRASGDQASALAAYEESSQLYKALESAHYNYAAHKGKFLAYLALNNDAMAEHELQIVLRLFDDYREKILSERQKAYFFDREQDTYDLAIDFSYSRLGDQHRAFNYSEVCRARNLSELMHHGAEVTQSDSGLDLQPSKDATSQKISPLEVDEILVQLPEQVQVVQYAVLEKKLLIWHLTASGIFSKSVEVNSTALRATVETALKQIARLDEKGAAASLKSLYSFIIEPIRERLDPNKVICFVPDKTLHNVPFSALLSNGAGRYLVQDYRLMSSPSATILINSMDQTRAKASIKAEHLLAVGDPSFDRTANPKLANLPGARQEVERIARNYLPSPRTLIGKQATRRSIIDELARADVAHFAVHYEIDPRSPLSSQLILASEPGQRAHSEPSGLNSGDIYRMNLTRTRLVVLSGCSTGIEQQFGGEGPIGFARSFLVAGVPVVVASLWPVDSNATAELMIAFHRFRTVERLSTTEALKRAQQEIMTRESYRHPYYWAGFTAIGGYSEF